MEQLNQKETNKITIRTANSSQVKKLLIQNLVLFQHQI
jgi:hypothetical protein